MRIFLVICFVFVGILGFGQATRSFTYGGFGDEVGVNIHEFKNNSFLLIGSSSSNLFGDNDIWLLHLDSVYQPIRSISIGTGANEFVSNSIMLENGSFILCGYADYNSSAGYKSFIYFFDENFTIVWQKIIGFDDWDIINKLEVIDSTIFLVGKTSNNETLRDEGWIVSFDFFGNQTNELLIQNNWNLEITDLAKVDSNRFVVSGKTEDGDKTNGYAAFLDIDLNILWEFQMEENFNTEFNTLVFRQNDLILLGGAFTNQLNELDYYLVELDLTKQLKGAYQQGVSNWNSNDYIVDIIEKPDSTIIYLGYANNLRPRGGEFQALHLDKDLNRLNGPTWGGPFLTFPFHMNFVNDDLILFLGYTDSFQNQWYDAYLVVTDSTMLLTDIPDQEFAIQHDSISRLATTIQDKEAFDDEQFQFINSQDFLTITSEIGNEYLLEIFDLNGKKIDSRSHNSSTVYHKSTLNFGIYICRLTSKNSIRTFKFSKL